MRKQVQAKNHSALFASAVVFCSSVFLAGCLDNADDPDGGDTRSVQVSGLAVDGYIAGARVYADLNGNNRRDSFEPRAFTDSLGFFSYRPELRDSNGNLIAVARDYCAEGVERHCLRIPPTQAETLIRVRGGYDLFSGEAFAGSLSRHILIPNRDSTFPLSVSPYTSLQQGVIAGTLDHWGEYFKDDAFTDTDALVAVEIHQVMVRLGERVLDRAGSSDITNEVTGLLYSQVRQLMGAVGMVAPAWYALQQPELEQAIASVLAKVGVGDAALAAELATFAIELRDTLRSDDDAFSGLSVQTASATATRDAVESRIQAILAYMGLKPVSVGENDKQLLTDLTQELKKFTDSRRAIDITFLTALVKDALDQDTGPLDLSRVGESVVHAVYPELARSFIRVEYDNGKGSLALFFDGEPTAAEPADFIADASAGRYAFGGDLTLCINGDLGALDFSDFSESADDSMRLTGSWERPNDRTLILMLSAFDGAYEKAASLRLRSGTNETNWEFTLAFDGDKETLEANRMSDDFQAIADMTVPSSQQACATYLNNG